MARTEFEEVKYGIIKELLEGMDHSVLISLWRQRCEGYNAYDDEILYMDDFEEYAKGMIDGNGLAWFLDRIKYGHFDMCDDYWAFNGYGNLVSFNHLEEDEYSPFSYADLYNYLVDGGTEDGEFDEHLEIMIDTFVAHEFALNEDEAREAISDGGYTANDFLTMNWEDIAENIREDIKYNKENE